MPEGRRLKDGRMKKSQETTIRKELRRFANRLKSENEALLKLIREINATGEANSLPSKKNKPKK